MFEAVDAVATHERALRAEVDSDSARRSFLVARRHLASGAATIVEVEQARAAWLRKQHLLDGLRDLAARQERDALALKIARLHREHDSAAVRLAALRDSAFNGGDFDQYAGANNAHTARGEEIIALIARRSALESDYPNAFVDEE